MWRPEDWGGDPCNECDQKLEDNYGLLCDLSCGKASQYQNFEAGADAMLGALIKYRDCYRSNLKSNDVPATRKGWVVFIPNDEVKCTKQR